MPIIVAKTAGFCFGVSRGVSMVYDLVDSGKKVCTLGPIIHNPHIINDLENRGVSIIDSPEQAPDGCTVVIRSHGVAQSVADQLSRMNINCIDATCPFVAKIHNIVKIR